MKIAVVGAGYVGLISAVGWAGLGHDVSCIEIDKAKAANISRGIAPIFEKGLGQRLREALDSGRLKAGTNFAPVAGADVVFICVGTPSKPDGSIDVSYIRACADSLAGELAGAKRFVVVAVRSTVVPGTSEEVVGAALSASGKTLGANIGLAMVPEFLREGSALEDFDSPDRIVVGCLDERTRSKIEKLYEPFSCPKQFTSIKTAEMIKYASNSFLAARLSLVNEFAELCEKSGVDVDDVMKGVGLDKRIGPHFLAAGPGFGGSCFPKDVRAIVAKAKEAGMRPQALDAVLASNAEAQERPFRMLAERMELKGRTVAVLGLAFKAGTDDVRESPALIVMKRLLDAGCRVRAYDPKAMERMREAFPQAHYCEGWAECLAGCDAAIILTAWPEFRRSPAEYKRALGDGLLIDARRMLPAEEAKKAGLRYLALGRGETE
ncbi:MAG: UDP-glucose/GDP-mannose dehydrogenase family protein [Candidatus Micrarchaeota archaeon]